MNSIMETHDSEQLENPPPAEFESEKKNRRKRRLNQILNAASKGRNTIKPALEVEEIAHQYHNLKIDFNRVKEENYRMKARLSKMNQQASKQDSRFINLN